MWWSIVHQLFTQIKFAVTFLVLPEVYYCDFNERSYGKLRIRHLETTSWYTPFQFWYSFSDWKLVFHAVSGNGKSVLHARNTMSPAVCTTDSGCLPLKFNLDNWRDNVTHLRSPLIDKWKSLNIVKVCLYICLPFSF